MSNETIDKSRRGFFTGSLLTREGRDKVNKQVSRLGLIPPGLKQFVSANNCINCAGNCAKICPQEIIKLHPENHELNNQPFLDFNRNGCTFCFECNTACPAYQEDKETPAPQTLGKAFLDHDKCYAWLNIICMSCMNICPDKLIKFDKSRKPSIQLDSCTGCGSCIKICPATAISITPTANSHNTLTEEI